MGMTIHERLRWMAPAAATALLALFAAGSPAPHAADSNPTNQVIVRFQPGITVDQGAALVEADGGQVTRRLSIINGVGAVVDGGELASLRADARVLSVTPNAAVKTRGGTPSSVVDYSFLHSAYNQSIKATNLWLSSRGMVTGAGVGVAVVDTGISGNLVDFKRN